MNHLLLRLAFFVLGVSINSFGIALITVGNLGTTQISGVPYVFSLQFPQLSFGVTTFIWNVLFIIIQVILLRREFKPSQFLQIVANFIFSAAVDVSMSILSFLNPQALWERLLCVVVGCMVLALGIVIELAPNIVVVPGDGLVNALSIVTKIRYGTVKVTFDVSLIIIASVCSLLLFGTFNGIGIGTIISAIIVGIFINVINRLFKFPDRIRALSLSRDGR